MIKKIQNFAEKNSLIWALIMGVVSSLILFIFGIAQITNKTPINSNYENTELILELIKMIFYIVLLYLFFNLFTFMQRVGVLIRIINITLFFIIFFVTYMLFSYNLEYWDNKINFIPVKEWIENGYDPPEEELSDTFCWFLFICLSFLNIVFLNILPIKFTQNKKYI